MEDWTRIGKTLEEILRPQTYPLAVKLVKDDSEFPDGTRRSPEKLAVCQALGMSRRSGATMGVTEDDSACPAASAAYGWKEIRGGEPGLIRFAQKAGYAADETAARTMIDGLSRLQPGRCRGLVVSPLTRTKIVPDVILVYGNPAQIMRLIQGSMYKQGRKLKSELAGMAASCSGAIVRAINIAECQVVVPGTMDRVCAGTYDDEMLFAIPAAKARELINGMEAQRLSRYPVPVVLPLPTPFPNYIDEPVPGSDSAGGGSASPGRRT